MIRKWMTVLLSLLLALMLPLAALADVQHTLSIVPGDYLASQQAVADLLNAFSITYTQGNRSGALTLNLDETAVCTVGMTADGTGLYVHSDLLSDDVLYVTWDDGFAFLTDIIQTMLGTDSVSETEMDYVKEIMDEARVSIVDAFTNGITINTTISGQTDAEALAAVAKMFEDDPAMIDYIKGIIGRMKVEYGSYASDLHDEAAVKTTMTMNNEDMLAICDTKYMSRLLTEALRMENPEMTEEELTKATEEELENIRQIYEEAEMNLTLAVYEAEGRTLPVSMQMDMKVVIEGESATMTMDYNSLTSTDGVNYTAQMSMGEDDEDLMQMLFTLNRGYDSVSEGQFSVLVEGEEVTFLYRAENLEDDIRSRSLGLYLRSGATAILPPVASDRPLVSVEFVSAQADPEVLSALENADASTSVNIMKLSAEEMEALMQEIGARSTQAMYTAIGNLPTSVLTLFMGGETE